MKNSKVAKSMHQMQAKFEWREERSGEDGKPGPSTSLKKRNGEQGQKESLGKVVKKWPSPDAGSDRSEESQGAEELEPRVLRASGPHRARVEVWSERRSAKGRLEEGRCKGSAG